VLKHGLGSLRILADGNETTHKRKENLAGRGKTGFWSRRSAFAAALVGLLALPLLLPASLQAGKKKTDTAPPANPADRRVTAYFDLSKIVWPSPPAIPRVAFKDIYTGEKIDPSLFAKKLRKKTWMDRLAGTLPADQQNIVNLPFQLTRTLGVAVDSKGNIYAADQGVGAVFIFDPQNKDHIVLIGNGRQANFGLIAGLAMDDDDRLFVTDAKLHHVLAFNARHEQEASFGAQVLVRPGGVAIDRENRLLYVADTGNDVVDVFDADNYKLLRQIGKPSRKHDRTEPGTFSLPEGVAVDSDGNVFVTDTFNDRVEMFDAEGQFISTFGKNGDGPADFERPKGIAIDRDGHVWVVDAAQNMVKIFSQQGRLLLYFGGPGYYPGQFMGPWGIAIGPSNQVVVSETFPGRVQVFRYTTDAEAATLKAQRDAEDRKPAVASAPTRPGANPVAVEPNSNRQDAATKAASPATVKAPAAQASPAGADVAPRKDSGAH